jgi:hypothetical protein
VSSPNPSVAGEASSKGASAARRAKKKVGWTQGAIFEVLNLNEVAEDATFNSDPNEPVSPKATVPLQDKEMSISPVQLSLNAKFWTHLLQEEQMGVLGPPVLDIVRQQRKVSTGESKMSAELEKAQRVHALAEDTARKRQEALLRSLQEKKKEAEALKQRKLEMQRVGANREWEEHWSDEHQRPYFFNVQTGESTWEPPSE